MEPSDEELLARYSHHPAPPAEGEGLPSDQEIADVFSQGCRDLSRSHEPPFLGGARAILARWGRPALAPAEGEVEKAPAVTEVIAWLRTEAEIDDGFELTQSAAYQRRAADLLEQRHPEPVPVSERLPEPGDCDGEGRCWWEFAGSDDYGPSWTLMKMHGIPSNMTRWLPAWVHALPLPAVEVKP